MLVNLQLRAVAIHVPAGYGQNYWHFRTPAPPKNLVIKNFRIFRVSAKKMSFFRETFWSRSCVFFIARFFGGAGVRECKYFWPYPVASILQNSRNAVKIPPIWLAHMISILQKNPHPFEHKRHRFFGSLSRFMLRYQ